MRSHRSARATLLLSIVLSLSGVARAQEPDLDDLLHLPERLVPGSPVVLLELDPERTRGGTWHIGGVTLSADDQGRLRFQPQPPAQPEAPLAIRFDDISGRRVLDTEVDVTWQTERPAVAPRSAASEGAGRLFDCSTRAFAGQPVCLCGVFPSGRERFLLDGRPLPEPTAITPWDAKLLLPEDVAPGTHVLAGDPVTGMDPGDAVLLEVIRVSASIDRDRLLRGQDTTFRLGIEGTERPLRVRIENSTPRIIRLEGGNSIDTMTSGGASNGLELEVRSRRRGDFRLSYTLDAESCPCAGSPLPESPPPFLADRVLAAVPLAAPAALAATAQALAVANGLVVSRSDALAGLGIGQLSFAIPDGRPAPAVAGALAASPQVLFAQPDFVYETSGGQARPGPALSPAPEPSASRQPRASAIDDRLAWGRRATGLDLVASRVSGRGVRVGVVDTAVDLDTAGLAGVVVEQRDFTDSALSPDVHGTQVAGILAGRAATSFAGGVAPAVELRIAKACRPYSTRSVRASCATSSLVRSLGWLVDQDARVLNLSIAGRSDDAMLRRAIDSAASPGRVLVSAAGNDFAQPEGVRAGDAFPARLEPVLGVTAVDAANALYRHASRGLWVELAAPGVDLPAPTPGNRLPLVSGTSFATAWVAGVAALLLERDPALDSSGLRRLLESTAHDLGDEGRDDSFGAGLIDACAALARIDATLSCDR